LLNFFFYKNYFLALFITAFKKVPVQWCHCRRTHRRKQLRSGEERFGGAGEAPVSSHTWTQPTLNLFIPWANHFLWLCSLLACSL
jgi:hypothetical protein